MTLANTPRSRIAFGRLESRKIGQLRGIAERVIEKLARGTALPIKNTEVAQTSHSPHVLVEPEVLDESFPQGRFGNEVTGPVLQVLAQTRPARVGQPNLHRLEVIAPGAGVNEIVVDTFQVWVRALGFTWSAVKP